MLNGIARGAARLPRSWALAGGAGAGRLLAALQPGHRRRAREALARSLPDLGAAERRALVWRMYAHMGRNYAEVLRWAGGCDQELEQVLPPDDISPLRAARARGRGLMILTAHLGNWDLLALWAARQYPLSILSKDLRQPALNTFWMALRQRAGLGILPAHNSFRRCIAVLRRNELLGFILDQNVIAREGVFVDFFGRPACTTPGLALLAACAQAPVLPVFLVRTPSGAHQVLLGELLEPPPDREPATIRAATQQYTAIIETFVRRHPDQWIWMHRRWRTPPPSAAGVS
ncbi:MAG: lysophospholipid acyltransferase family protein [Candidatus Marinimicrobia bacterium]|nr:lysophospholipid acyltransferase family protein [Candidatus Neomarinimicrobiota bacterium]